MKFKQFPALRKSFIPFNPCKLSHVSVFWSFLQCGVLIVVACFPLQYLLQNITLDDQKRKEDKNSSTNFKQRLMKEVVQSCENFDKFIIVASFFKAFFTHVLRILGRGPQKSSQFEDSKTPLKSYEKLSETEYIFH